MAEQQWVKVWPLVEVTGFDAMGETKQLKPGIPGWMLEKDAARAASEGKVQPMAGMSTSALKEPGQTVAMQPQTESKKKGRYMRKDMRAEEDLRTEETPKEKPISSVLDID